MQQKICVSKKITLLVGVGIVFLFIAIALNSLTNRQTSTNSRAAKPALKQLQIDTPIPTQPPTPTIQPNCNAYGEVVVKDSKGQLWSWGSVEFNTLGRYCGSEKYYGAVKKNTLYLEFPTDVDKSNYSEKFSKLSNGKCTAYGIRIDIENNKIPFLAGTLNRKVPAIYVGRNVPEENCNLNLDKAKWPDCRVEIKTVEEQCYRFNYTKCNTIEQPRRCCGMKLYNSPCRISDQRVNM